MNTSNPGTNNRVGEEYRSNPDRYFHVMTEGWYIFTREGIRGPFVDRGRATSYLKTYISDIKSENDPSSSWRL